MTGVGYFFGGSIKLFPTISIIMPVYNGEKYINEAIKSILIQSCNDWELIIIDDCSTDNTQSICQNYESQNDRIHYYRNSHMGISFSRNFGIEKSKGRYISFLDSDDVWCKEFYTDKINEMLAATDTEIISFNYIESLDKMYKNGFIRKNNLSLVYDNRFNLSDNHFCSFIYKCEIAENVRFREDLSICEDVDFLFRALIECKNIMIVDTIIFAYRMNDCSVTHSKKHKYDTKQILERNLKAWVSLYYEFSPCKNLQNMLK